MAIKQAKIIVVTSVKGGTGKTTTTINLAGILEKLNKKILLVDLDIYASGIAVALNVKNEKDLFILIEDLNNNRFSNLDDYITKYDDSIDLLLAPKDPRNASKINSKYLNIVLAKAKLKYDVILIDTNHILNDINLVALDNSDETLYLIRNDLIDLKNMRTMVAIYEDMEKSNYKVILNDSADKFKNFFTKYDIKHMIKKNIDYIIPSSLYLNNYDKYIMDGKILTLDKNFVRKNKKPIDNLEKMLIKILESRETEAEIRKEKLQEDIKYNNKKNSLFKRIFKNKK